MTEGNDELKNNEVNEQWVLMVDRASNKFRASVKIILITPDLSSIKHTIQLEFQASNNEAEYKALIVGMLMVINLCVKNLKVCSDSNLVISQKTSKY